MPDTPTSYSKLWIALGAFVVIAFGAFIFGYKQIDRGSQGSGEEFGGYDITQTLRSGDFQGAVQEKQNVLNDPSATAVEKARATFVALGSEYRVTGENAARIKDIQDMKKIILDETVDTWTRVQSLNALAGQYSISGRDPAVFAEIYKDAPFNEYLVKGDPDLSARKLFEWSYSIRPTSASAINIARWYTEQVVLDPELDPKLVQDYAKKGEEYMNRADQVSLQELKDHNTYINSTRYLLFRYWRAIIVSRLSFQLGEPYINQFRSEYEKFIEFAQTQKNPLAKEYLLYARLFYAQRMAFPGDNDGAKVQLDQLATEMGTAANPETNIFFKFLKSESANNPTGASWTVVKDLSKISPAFKAAVEKVIAPATL